MGAHQQVDLPCRQSGQQPLLRRPLHRPGEQPHPHPGGGEQGVQSLGVLLGQQLGGGHQGALAAVPGAQPGPEGGHRRLARAHVPLDQPVHGPPRGQVGGYILHGPALGPGGGKGQQLLELLHRPPAQPPARPLAPALLQEGHAAGEGEQLLEDHPPPGNLQRLEALGIVDVLVGELHLAQAVGQADLLRDGLLPPGGVPLQRPPGQVGHHTVGDPRRQGIDGQDAAGDLPRPLPLEHRVGHGLPPAHHLHPAVKHIALPGAQGILQIGLIEEGQVQHPRVVHRPGLHQLQPLADPGQGGGLGHHGAHAARLPRRGLPDGAHLPPVLVAEGEVVQQILQAVQPQPGQLLPSGRADAWHLGQGDALLVRHASTSSASLRSI